MVPELSQIMSFLDRNSENFKEGEYLEMCNLLMSLHKKIENVPITPEFAATQPLPPVTPVVNATHRVFSAWVPPRHVNENNTREINRLRSKLWVRMSNGRKRGVMIRILGGVGCDDMSLFELESSVLALQVNLGVLEQRSWLDTRYDIAMRRHNSSINVRIRSLEDLV